MTRQKFNSLRVGDVISSVFRGKEGVFVITGVVEKARSRSLIATKTVIADDPTDWRVGNNEEGKNDQD